MPTFAAIAFASVCALLVCCDRSRRFEGIDAGSLKAEAQKLIDEAKRLDDANGANRSRSGRSSGTYYLPPEKWPPTIKQLKPQNVRYGGSGVWILYFKWVSKENGFFIPPQGSNLAPDDGKGGAELKEIKPGVYHYRSE